MIKNYSWTGKFPLIDASNRIRQYIFLQLLLCLNILECWTHITQKVICTYSPLNNFQQGLVCISDSITTSIQVTSTLLQVLEQCTSKHFTTAVKRNYFHITKRWEKGRVPSWLHMKPYSRQWAELKSLCPKSWAPGCGAPFLLNKSPVPASSGWRGWSWVRIPLLCCSTGTQHYSLAVLGHLNFSFLLS